MKNHQLYRFPLVVLFLWAAQAVLPAQSQYCANQCLKFDGAGDYIELTPITFLPSNTNFTVEAWFTSTATTSGGGLGNFRRLIALSGTGTRLEAGDLAGKLNLFWVLPSGSTFGPAEVYAPTIRDGNCHHIALVYISPNIRVYLDGVLIYTAPGFNGGAIQNFRIGRPNAPSVNDWEGLVDGIRLWSVARSSFEINLFKDCELTGGLSNLRLSWTLNQNAIPGGDNTGLTVAVDGSNAGNNGTLHGFSLNDPLASNYFCNDCLPKYQLEITNKPAPVPSVLTEICAGDPAHFAITEDGGVANLIPNSSVSWEYSDDGGANWSAVGDPHFSGLSFLVPQGVILTECPANAAGYTDRKYRAKITSTWSGQICTYYVPEQNLRICCPATGSITLTPQPPFTPPVNTLCAGPTTVEVALGGPAYLENMSIQWYINGVYNSALDNLTNFTYTGQAADPQLCFEARLTNCSCPTAIIQACLNVDPAPEGTVIDQLSDLQLIPGGTAFDYYICPGNEAVIGMFGLTQNCTPVWQFRFDPPNDTWQDLYPGNTVLNTNTLPPNPSLPPFIWPAGAECVYYRIECKPQSYPNSQCATEYSNTVKICLQPDELPAPVISATPNPICAGGASEICIVPPVPPTGTSIQWYCNGIPCGTDDDCIQPATPGGSYVVAISDGCFSKNSNVLFLGICEPVAIFTCPVENPCACFGQPIVLDGTMSYSNCGTIVNYTWKVEDSNGTHYFNGPTLSYQFQPPVSSTTFTLTVTDSNGCTDESKPLTITPCEN